MKRKQFFQFSNQNWYPAFLKRDMYEFMTWFVGRANAAKPFMPVFDDVFKKSKTKSIVNIDSNLGAGFETIANLKLLPADSSTTNLPIENFNTQNVGIYTFVNSFHQLKPEQARYYLTEISKSRNSVAVLEGNNDSLWQVVGMTIFVPLTVLLSAPFVKPFSITRIVFTYLIPLLPIVTMLDGFFALFKLYNPSDLNELVSTIKTQNYIWESGKLPNGRGGKIIYLIGYPSI